MLKSIVTFALMMLASFGLYAGQEQTLAIIKPDAVAANHIGEILTRFEQSGLRIAALRMARFNQLQAEKFYAIHKDRPFYNDLVSFMISGPVVAIVLEGENAVAKSRELIGATNPKEATKGTIRADFAKSVSENAIHGSDSLDNAKTEIDFFFPKSEIFLRN